MAKRAIFKGKGEIEFNLPSKKNSTTLKNGESIEVVEQEDLRIVKALRPLGLFLEDVSDKDIKESVEQVEASVLPAEEVKPEVSETEEVETPQEENGVEEKKEFVEPKVEEVSKPKFTFEELHVKRADELRALVAEIGAEVQEGASKKEMANAILKKLGE